VKITEPTVMELLEARSQILLADTQKALQSKFRQYGYSLSLDMDDPDKFGNVRRDVIAAKDGVEVARTYVHPRTDDGESIAFSLDATLKAAARKAGQA